MLEDIRRIRSTGITADVEPGADPCLLLVTGTIWVRGRRGF